MQVDSAARLSGQTFLPSATLAFLLLWPWPRLAGQGEEPEPPLQEVPAESLRDETLILEDRYREILADWCRGSAAAASELSDFEIALADRRVELGDERASTCFHGIEENTWTELAEVEPLARLALAGFYYEVYLAQENLEDPWSAVGTKEKVESLLAGHVGESKSSESRQDAAMILGVLAYAEAIPASALNFEAARETFEHALDLDPELDAARYFAAVLAEKLGDVRGAESHLKVLVANRPEDAEARLRLGLTTVRRGREKAALDLLHPIVEQEGAAEWIRILATQETARLLAELGRVPEAVEVLRSAIERYPRNSRLAVQLSHLQVSDWRESSALVERLLGGGPIDPGETPRVRYEEPRLTELIEVRQRLERRLEEARPLLAGSLGVLAGQVDTERRRLVPCQGLLR